MKELVQATARTWRRLTPAQRAGGAIVAGNYGEARLWGRPAGSRRRSAAT